MHASPIGREKAGSWRILTSGAAMRPAESQAPWTCATQGEGCSCCPTGKALLGGSDGASEPGCPARPASWTWCRRQTIRTGSL